MPKRKKLTDWTTDEALKRLFPKPVAEQLKKAAHDGSGKGPQRPRRAASSLWSPHKKG